ncbi:hypothetical protein ScPMuIL_011871 [Solemya velum]
MSKKTVSIIGSGNWGSVIAKIVGKNVIDNPDKFERTVRMWMYEEMVDGQKLTEIVNTKHENVKYLPGVKLSENVVANPDVAETVKGADILIFVLPHQFVRPTCKHMEGHVKKGALAVSLIKGFAITEDGIQLISNMITECIGIDCAVLMGANLAGEVADEQFCETTIGNSDKKKMGKMLNDLFETSYFRCTVIEDIKTVEMCGALKNVVGIGAGIVDGLNYGDNTKAAVIRLGLMEMVEFGKIFFPGCKMETFFESCGVADLVATCHGGRNRMLGEAVVKSDKPIKELEKEILHGQSFQGPLVAKEIYGMLAEKNMLSRFPLFAAIHTICERKMDPRQFIDCLREHPEHV